MDYAIRIHEATTDESDPPPLHNRPRPTIHTSPVGSVLLLSTPSQSSSTTPTSTTDTRAISSTFSALASTSLTSSLPLLDAVPHVPVRGQSSPAVTGEIRRHRHTRSKRGGSRKGTRPKRKVMEASPDLAAMIRRGSMADDEDDIEPPPSPPPPPAVHLPAVRIRPAPVEKEVPEEPLAGIDSIRRAIGWIDLPMRLAGLHSDPETGFWWGYVRYVATMLLLCLALCVANSHIQARAFRNYYSDYVLDWLHVSVAVTWVALRYARPAVRALAAMAKRENGSARIAARVKWLVYYFWFASIAATVLISMGWVAPVSLSAWAPSEREREQPGIMFFNYVHGIGLYLIVIPWVFVFVGITVQFSMIMLYMYICIEGLFGRIKGAVAVAAAPVKVTRENFHPSRPVRTVSLANLPMMLSVPRADSDDDKKQTPHKIKSVANAKSDANAKSGADAKTNVEESTSTDSESYEYQVLRIENMNGQDLLSHIDDLTQYIRAVSSLLSIPFVCWLLTGEFMLSAGVTNVVATTVFGEGRSASVSRQDGLSGADDTLWHAFVDTFYIAGGPAILATILYPPASVTAHFAHAMYQFSRIGYGVKTVDDAAWGKLDAWSDRAKKLLPGYYVFFFRMTGRRAFNVAWATVQFVASSVFVQIAAHYAVVPG